MDRLLAAVAGNAAPEKRQSLRPGYLARTYWKVLSSPRFLFVCAALTLNFAGFFLYVLSAPVFLMGHLGLSEREFLWLFGPSMSGLMTGAWISGRLAGKRSPSRTIATGYLAMGGAVVLNLSINLTLPPGIPWSVLPIFFYTLGMAIAMPSLTLIALDPYAAQRGLAASCQTFLQAGFNAIVAALIAPLLWGSTMNLALGMAGLMTLGGISAWQYHRLKPT